MRTPVCTFARSFPRRSVDPWVIRAVHQELAAFYATESLVVPVHEDDRLSASLAWNWRSEYAYFFQGNGTNTPGNGARYFASAGSLSASLGYRITKDLSVHLDANNLTNEIRYTYHITENAPAAFYENGRQYFASVRWKF